MAAETDRSSHWENDLTEYGLDDVNKASLEEFCKRAVQCGRLEEMATFDTEELLTGLGLYEQGKLTNAGYYLFSNRKPAVLKMAVFATDERITFSDIKRIEDNVFNLIRKGFAYIKEHIRWRVEIGSETSRIKIPEIPAEAIREIIVNSFAHADYQAITENEIDITPARAEICNHGTFPAGLSPEMFARQKIRSLPRNEVILNTLYRSKDAELFGSGFRKVYELCDKDNVRVEPSFENDSFAFIFYRNTNQKHGTQKSL